MIGDPEDVWWRRFWHDFHRQGGGRFADQVWTWYARAGAAAARAVAEVTAPTMGRMATAWLVDEIEARGAEAANAALVAELRARGCGLRTIWPITVEVAGDRVVLSVGGEDDPERRAIVAGIAVAMGLSLKFGEDGRPTITEVKR